MLGMIGNTRAGVQRPPGCDINLSRLLSSNSTLVFKANRTRKLLLIITNKSVLARAMLLHLVGVKQPTSSDICDQYFRHSFPNPSFFQCLSQLFKIERCLNQRNFGFAVGVTLQAVSDCPWYLNDTVSFSFSAVNLSNICSTFNELLFYSSFRGQ